jgi:tetrapyrrole methylase family protein / MazG family protein
MGFSIQQVEAALRALDAEPLDSLQIAAAELIAGQYYPHLDPAQPALLLGVTDRALAERVRQTLSRAYPLEHPLTLIDDQRRSATRLAQLAAQPGYTQTTAMHIPPIPSPGSYEALQDIVAHLRAPEGCPWDRELTWAKLRSSLLEEAHELLAALDLEDGSKIREELGDLLLQVGLQAQIATEEGRFRFADVIAGITEKLIRRHPHVFGDTTVSGTAEVLANWEAIKAAERKSNGEKRSPLSGIPKGLPALAQADAYLDRMSRLRKAEAPVRPWAPLAALPPDAPITDEMLGTALFGIVAWAQSRGLDAESALRAANTRFAAGVEESAA